MTASIPEKVAIPIIPTRKAVSGVGRGVIASL